MSSGVVREEGSPLTHVPRVPTPSFFLYQDGYFPSSSSLVEAGMREGQVHKENEGIV